MRKIMIVDDDVEFLEELTQILNAAGFTTLAFSYGDNVVSDAVKEKPDVILLDLKIKGNSGFRIADELNSVKETGSIPIIAITGVFVSDEHRLPMQLCGIKKCLVKPFNPLDVIAAIEEVTK